jgi:hypothetical protein
VPRIPFRPPDGAVQGATLGQYLRDIKSAPAMNVLTWRSGFPMMSA